MADCRHPPGTGAYQKAISQVVHKNDVALDIGAGSGILSFFACLAGARKVYAVEMSGALPLARDDAPATASTTLSNSARAAPRKSSFRNRWTSSFPIQDAALACKADCWAYCSTPESAVPQAGRQDYSSLPSAPGRAGRNKRWTQPGHLEKGRYGLDLSSIRRFAASTDYHLKVEPENLLAPPASLTTIHFEEVSSPYVAGETLSVAAREGVRHGLAAWIVLELAPGISFTNSPLAPTVDWLHSFFP